MAMTQRRSLRYISLLAAAVFFIAGLLPFFAVYPSQARLSTGFVSAQEAAQDKVLICTSSGYQWISRGDLASGDTPDSDHKTAYECGICAMYSHGMHAIDARVMLFMAPPPIAGAYHLPSLFTANSRLSVRRHAPRAPPSYVI